MFRNGPGSGCVQRASHCAQRARLDRASADGVLTDAPAPGRGCAGEWAADRSGYTFAAPTRFDKLFSGIAVPFPQELYPEGPVGTEDIRPEDTWDGDYERLLDEHSKRC